jgi:hypothetical protein
MPGMSGQAARTMSEPGTPGPARKERAPPHGKRMAAGPPPLAAAIAALLPL